MRIDSRFLSQATISAFLLVAVLFTSMVEAQAIPPYDSPPSSFDNVKAKISNSLVVAKYDGKSELFFAGNYNLSQETKDRGINSVLVGPKGVIERCFFQSITARTATIQLDYNSKSYRGTCSNYGAGDVDMASIETSLNVPTLPLWDSYWPRIGGWLIAAYYIDGFGILYKETRVSLVNKLNYVLAVQKFLPSPIGSALIFNQNGAFVGVLTDKGRGQVPTDYFKVLGAPLQCAEANTTESSITNCATRSSLKESAQKGVWTIDESASPTPTPSPTISKTNTDSREIAINAYDQSLDTYRKYQTAKLRCTGLFKNSSERNQKVLDLFSIKLCESKDVEASSAYFNLQKLNPSNSANTPSPELIASISNIGKVLESLIASLDEAGPMVSETLSVAELYLDIQDRLFDYLEQIGSIEESLNSLPVKVAKSIRSDANFDYLMEYLIALEQIETNLGDAESELRNLNKPNPIAARDFNKTISTLARLLPNRSVFKANKDRALASVPDFYCRSGKKVLLSTKVRCPVGYTKIKIKLSV